MAPYKLIVILCVSLACFLASADILYAQVYFSHASISHFATNNIDPCTGTTLSPAQTWANPIGNACVGGAIYAGTGYASPLHSSFRYMVTPSGCTNSSTPACAGTTKDSVTQVWATGAYFSNLTHASDLTNGQNNTGVLASLSQTGGNTTPAAAFCSNMTYGGYHDWFLPSKNELNYVLYKNMSGLTTPPAGKIGGFQASSNYWSSTEGNAIVAWFQFFYSGAQINGFKTNGFYVRCARIY